MALKPCKANDFHVNIAWIVWGCSIIPPCNLMSVGSILSPLCPLIISDCCPISNCIHTKQEQLLGNRWWKISPLLEITADMSTAWSFWAGQNAICYRGESVTLYNWQLASKHRDLRVALCAEGVTALPAHSFPWLSRTARRCKTWYKYIETRWTRSWEPPPILCLHQIENLQSSPTGWQQLSFLSQVLRWLFCGCSRCTMGRATAPLQGYPAFLYGGVDA